MNQDKIIYLDCNSEQIKDSIEEKETNYTLDQLVLVRTTDTFPIDKIIQTPIHGHAYSYGNSSIIGDAILDKLRSKLTIQELMQKDKLKQENQPYQVCFETLRTTIHFTINGLVSSHMYGNFENRDYIIIEPLKYHIEDKSLCSLRAEDTYFNDDMPLSDEAALIISEPKFKEIKNNKEYINTLEKFKLFIYKGKNQEEAVQKTLSHLGYDSFIVNNHGYTNGLKTNTAANKMYNFIDNLVEKYNLNCERHFFSKEKSTDEANRLEQGEITDKEHFIYIVTNTTNLPQELKQEIINVITNSEEELSEYELNQITSKVIEIVPLEEIKQLTKQFNQQFINNINELRQTKHTKQR